MGIRDNPKPPQKDSLFERPLVALLTVGMVLLMVPAAAQVGGAGSAAGEATGSATGDLAGTATSTATGSATGGVAGDAAGDVAGDVTGEATGDVTGSATGATTVGSSLDGAADVQGGADAQLRSTLDQAAAIDAASSFSADAETRAEAQADALVSLGADAQGEAVGAAESANLFGSFVASGDARTGSFAAFTLDGAALADHRVQTAAGEATFLTRIDMQADARQTLDGGAATHIWTDGAHLQAYDNAEGTILIEAQTATSIAIDVAADAGATVSSTSAWMSSNGQAAALMLAGSGQLTADSDNRIRADLQPGAALRFEASADGRASSDWVLEQEAFAKGRLGAEAAVVAVDGDAVVQAEEYLVDVEGKSAAEGDVRIDVSSEHPEPRVVKVDLASELFASADAIAMTFDGQQAAKVATAADVMAAADAGQATYAVAEAEGHYEAYVHVPGFSTHELAFVEESSSSSDADSPSNDTPGIGIVALLGLLGLALIGRRS